MYMNMYICDQNFLNNSLSFICLFYWLQIKIYHFYWY